MQNRDVLFIGLLIRKRTNKKTVLQFNDCSCNIIKLENFRIRINYEKIIVTVGKVRFFFFYIVMQYFFINGVQKKLQSCKK